jgi:hypothetical protein
VAVIADTSRKQDHDPAALVLLIWTDFKETITKWELFFKWGGKREVVKKL